MPMSSALDVGKAYRWERPKEGPDHVVRMEAQQHSWLSNRGLHAAGQRTEGARGFYLHQDDLSRTNPDKFWKNVGKRRNGQLESFVGKRKAMEEAVAQIVSPNDPPEVKLRKIYDRVQQIRNKSYELQKTEQEEKREKEKPAENVEDVWKRGYGNGVQR